MATLSELYNLHQDSGLLNKMASACAVKAVAILAECGPSTARLAWAEEALADSESKAHSLIWYVLGVNAGAAVASITGASDAAIQSNISDAIDALYP